MTIANYDLQLDTGWHFCLGQVKRFRDLSHVTIYSAAKAGGALGDRDVFLEENPWKRVRVPHDWMTELPYDPEYAPTSGSKPRGEGWYYTCFTLPENPIECAQLIFEGVLGDTTVYVNGMVAARNHSGYNRFTAQVASYLLPGAENMIALHVDASTWEGWSYEGAGLYRPVSIRFRKELHFSWEDCFVRGKETDDQWAVAADLAAAGLPQKGVTVRTCLQAPDGTEKITESKNGIITIPIENPVLWSPENPALYGFSAELKRNGETVDTFRVLVGLRTVEWRADGGMYLNGKPYPIKGICCHQDHGGVGAAVVPELMEYRVQILKEMGINAYRCVHHAMPESFYAICDRLGMLVMAENRHYSVSEDAQKQLDALVLTARNHPSVFLYSLFNEEPWQRERRGYLMAKEMRARIRQLDDTRAVTGAMESGPLEAINASDAMDVIGLNYQLRHYPAVHERTPSKVILGTENCPTYTTRGVYETDNAAQVFSGYAEDHASFSESLEETMECVDNLPYNAGCFVFSGIDSYGEPDPHGYPSIATHWGMTDLCGFPKGGAYLLSAYYKDEPYAQLFPDHWNFTDGQSIRVCAFTNGESAELFLNGQSLGKQEVIRRRAQWTVPFAKGTLSVCAEKDGKTVKSVLATAGKPARLTLCDVTPASGSPRVRIINLGVCDEAGNAVPEYEGTVHLKAYGGAVLGVSNGDPNDHTPLNGPQISLFHGRAQVIVSADTTELSAVCNELKSAWL